MNVLFSLPSIPQYRARFEMLKCLAGKVDSLAVVTTEGMDSYPDMPENMTVQCLPKSKIHFLGKLICNTGLAKVDIIHDTFGYLIPFGPVSKAFGSKRYVTSVYGSATGWLRRAREIGYDNTTEIRAQRKLMAREFLNSRFADFIMVNSEDFIRDYTETYGYPVGKMAVVPNSIIVSDEIEFMNNPTSQFKILYVGRLSKIKGINLLLEAHQEILAEGQDVRLTVIGKPIAHDRPYLESRKWKNVDFIEEMPFEELTSYYLGADVCIHPSAQEGMPRVVMESLSFGTPVIASDLPGIRSIDGSGKFVRIMNRFDSHTLKDSILQEITSPRKTLPFFSDAREHMRSFSPGRTASMIRANYEKLF